MAQPFQPDRSYAGLLDAADSLRGYQHQFVGSDNGMVYMDGNSLGRLPLSTVPCLQNAMTDLWGSRLVRAWNENWIEAPRRSGEKIARLAGAQPGQILVCDSTSINLFKLVSAALERQKGRHKIITDDMNFPSDIYILQGCIRTQNSGHQLEIIPSADGIYPDLDTLYHSIDSDTALVTLSHVAFKSGYLYDAAGITLRAHQAGALVLWDLSHSIGVIPSQLDAWQVDLAVGCTYKYLNGGPGAPAFLYVRRDLQDELLSPLWGWFGQQSPFEFGLDYKPAAGIDRFLCGTPPVLSLLAIEPALDMILEAGLPAIRAKSIQLTNYMVALFEARLASQGFSLGSPRQAEMRGSHISIRHADGYRINRALIELLNVIPDFRQPDNIRLGLSPLYSSYEDVWEAVDRICTVIEQKTYLHFPTEHLAVT